MHIFNFSLNHSIFPTVWKSAIVCSVPKTKNSSELRHFRSISILCVISKALECIVATQMTEFLERSNSLDPFQNAYWRGYSTQTALIRVMDDIRLAADKREIIVSAFFDFSKAIDCVNHKLLINKLRNKNFSASTLNWFYSYPDNRVQLVRDPATFSCSEKLLVTAGVPKICAWSITVHSLRI